MLTKRQIDELMTGHGIAGADGVIEAPDPYAMLFRLSQRNGYEFLWLQLPSDHLPDNGLRYTQITALLREQYGVRPGAYAGEADMDRLREAGIIAGFFMASSDYFSRVDKQPDLEQKCRYISSRYWEDGTLLLSRLRGGDASLVPAPDTFQ